MNASEGNLMLGPDRSPDALTELRGLVRTVLDLFCPGTETSSCP